MCCNVCPLRFHAKSLGRPGSRGGDEAISVERGQERGSYQISTTNRYPEQIYRVTENKSRFTSTTSVQVQVEKEHSENVYVNTNNLLF